jgi:AcrR family transcriptional regulator
MSDHESTRDRILDAATQVFAASGLAGARVDAIAKAAGCNKQLLYHYFGSKAGLFEAVVLRVLASRPPISLSSQEDVEAQIAESISDIRKKGDWVRMLAWEALQSEGCAIAAYSQRKAMLDESVTEIERGQQAGIFDKTLPPRFLLLAMMGMSMIPWLLPQHVRLLTDLNHDDPAFLDQYGELLAKLMTKLSKPDAT